VGSTVGALKLGIQTLAVRDLIRRIENQQRTCQAQVPLVLIAQTCGGALSLPTTVDPTPTVRGSWSLSSCSLQVAEHCRYYGNLTIVMRLPSPPGTIERHSIKLHQVSLWDVCMVDSVKLLALISKHCEART
jgi:hypothetical protein